MYAFFTMVMFGSIYYIMPRLLQVEWPSARLISLHFWTTSVGITLYVFPLIIGGILQGLAMNNPDIPFLDPNKYSVVTMTLPYLKVRSISGIMLAVGHTVLGINFFWILLRWSQAARLARQTSARPNSLSLPLQPALPYSS